MCCQINNNYIETVRVTISPSLKSDVLVGQIVGFHVQTMHRLRANHTQDNQIPYILWIALLFDM